MPPYFLRVFPWEKEQRVVSMTMRIIGGRRAAALNRGKWHGMAARVLLQAMNIDASILLSTAFRILGIVFIDQIVQHLENADAFD
mmetsp:Transcript_53773/g.160959  ORF Transcript_53773/g.160959 Transcript_53773/m.160959 type:complete len:85 (+) Transcript_53773:346-600(+)